MKIANGMFDHYFSKVTFVWFGDHDEPPDDLSGYDPLVHEVAHDADQRNDLLPLRLAIDFILLYPDRYDLQDHCNYPYTDEELRDILKYLRKKLYPGAEPPNEAEVRDVEIIGQSRFDWWDQRQRDGLHDPSRVVTNGPAAWVVEYDKAVAEGREPRLPGE